MGKTMSLLVMDDSASIRHRIVELLSEVPGLATIYQSEDAASAAQMLSQHQPDVVILDIQVPPGAGLRNGIDVLRLAKRQHPKSSVIMLTNYNYSHFRDECARLGADYFFDKSSEFELVPDAVIQILRRSSAGHDKDTTVG